MHSLTIVLISVDLDRLFRYTTDGKYAHLRTTPLLRAMYGFDPESGERFTWEDYRRESREAGGERGQGRQGRQDGEHERWRRRKGWRSWGLKQNCEVCGVCRETRRM